MVSFVLLIPLFGIAFASGGFFFMAHWVGFVILCRLYQEARRSGRFFNDFLLHCWIVWLGVYSICFAWILSFKSGVYLFAVFVFSFFFPLVFTAHYLLTSKIRSKAVQVAAVFGVFFLFERILSLIPALVSVGLDFFFQPPAAILCVLKFFPYTVWSSWVFATCFAIACWVDEKRARALILPGILLAGMAVLVTTACVDQRSQRHGPERSTRVALIQPNLPFSEAWRIDHPEEIREKYRELAVKAAQSRPELIVLPLYTLPEDVYREPAFLAELAKRAMCPILVASHVPTEAGDLSYHQGFMNLAFLIDPDGTVRDLYQSVFSIPFDDRVSKIADKYRLIRTPFGRLGVLLCYEDMIPALAGEAARLGAQALVSLSNPGLLQRTSMLDYQFFQDQMRAAETALPMIRVSPNGYTVLIDRTGRIVQKVALGVEEILIVQLPLAKPAKTQGADTPSPLLSGQSS